MNFAIKGLFILTLSSLCLTACGGDTGNSSNPAPEEEENLSSSLSHLRSSSSASIPSATSVVDSDAHDLKSDVPFVSEIVDDATGAVYSTRSVGVYTWTENIGEKDASVKSTCYAYDDSKCDLYGRLYMKKNAEDLCPAGFSFPSVADWKYMMLVESNSIAYAGVCFKRDSLECTGINDSAQYFADGDSAVMIDRFGLVSATKAVDNGFYSLRCVKYRSIVEKMSDLPDCGGDTYNSSTIFVATKDSSYYCRYGEWKNDSNRGTCRSDEVGEKYLIKDLVYICKGGTWQLTTIEDTDIKCTDKNLYEEYVVNGTRYACTDTGMAKLSYPASKIGYCNPDRNGDMIEIDSTNYVCNDFVWRYATVSDFYGECNVSKYGLVVTVDGKRYICSAKGSWRLTTDTEDELGPCTEKLQDSILKNKSGAYYLCDRWEWYRASKNQVLGTCSDANEGDTITYESYLYECSEKTWKTHSLISKELGFCTTKNKGAKGVYRDTVYYCYSDRGKDWAKASELELLLGFCRKDTTYVVEKEGVFYKCYSGSWKEAAQSDVLKSCYSTAGERKVYNGKEYVCDTTALNSSGAWYALTKLDSTLGDYCRTELLNKAVMHNDTVYVCRVDSKTKTKKTWVVGTIENYLGKCDRDNLGHRVFNGLDTTVCINNSCGDERIKSFIYDGRDTVVCIAYGTIPYYWEPIVRERIVDPRDNEEYGVLTFGTQKWLTRDLHYWKTGLYEANGKLFENPKEYEDQEQSYYHTFYYTWNDALGGANICPEGTHIPSGSDWKTLFEYAKKLNPVEGVNTLFIEDSRVSSVGKDYYGMGLRRNGFVDMDGKYSAPGVPIIELNDDYRSLYYWISDAGKTDSTGSAFYVDSLMNINYQKEALKVDAYAIRCIVD